MRKRSDNQGAIQMFAGLVKCIDCGYALAYTKNGGKPYYQCSQYNVKGKDYCSSHYPPLRRALRRGAPRRAAQGEGGGRNGWAHAAQAQE
ncbi:MAG: zinc ribbon domain-containing protein [Oscillospiraceae bacterium]